VPSDDYADHGRPEPAANNVIQAAFQALYNSPPQSSNPRSYFWPSVRIAMTPKTGMLTTFLPLRMRTAIASR
jgi:hypothetical protein